MVARATYIVHRLKMKKVEIDNFSVSVEIFGKNLADPGFI